MEVEAVTTAINKEILVASRSKKRQGMDSLLKSLKRTSAADTLIHTQTFLGSEV